MSTQATFSTPRLRLRPFTVDDAPCVQKLAGDKAIADTTLNIPHPYEDGMAEAWISTHKELRESGKGYAFAIVLADSEQLIGCIGLLNVDRTHQRAEMGYWIGKPYWRQGFCTEAAQALVKYGFQELGLNRLYAYHLTRNPASGRVMQKIGMIHEGCLRRHSQRWGVYEDLDVYGILKDEYSA